MNSISKFEHASARYFFAILVVSVTAVAPTWADDSNNSQIFQIAPIATKPGGQTYGRWAAEWFQWAFGMPEETNANLDLTGEKCDTRQVGDTWFLAQAPNPFFGEPVVRLCTIPADKALFVPLLNRFFGAELTLPPEERTEEFARDAAKCTEPLEGFAEIDGVRIGEKHLRQFSTGRDGSPSPIFTVQLPPENIFGLDEIVAPELVLTPAAEDGFYLYIKPLSAGMHTVRWMVTGCGPGRSQDITYYLTVLAPDSDLD